MKDATVPTPKSSRSTKAGTSDQNVPFAQPTMPMPKAATGAMRAIDAISRRPLGGSGGGSARVIAIGTSDSIMNMAEAEKSWKSFGSAKRSACWPVAEPEKWTML